jgi:hypothetical protein
MMGVPTLPIAHPEDLDVLHATFATPDLTVFCCLDEVMTWQQRPLASFYPVIYVDAIIV